MKRTSKSKKRSGVSALIRRATKVMRADPNFQRLNKKWHDLMPLERAKLIGRILRKAPGHQNQRALARLLQKHINDESSIRYYRKLSADDQTRRLRRLQEPGPACSISKIGQEEPAINQTPVVCSLANDDSEARVNSTLSQDLASAFPLPPVTSANVSPKAPEPEKIAEEIISRVKLIAVSTNAALGLLNSLRERFRSASAEENGSIGLHHSLNASVGENLRPHEDPNDPLRTLVVFITTECKDVETALKILDSAEEDFRNNPHWRRPPTSKEQEAARTEWERNNGKIRPQQARKVPPPESFRTLR